MDPLVHNSDQGTVKTVGSTRRTCSEEGEDCPIGRKGDGHLFLGLTRQGVIYIDYLEKGKTVTGPFLTASCHGRQNVRSLPSLLLFTGRSKRMKIKRLNLVADKC